MGLYRRFFASGAWEGYYFPRHLNLYNFGRLAALLNRVGLAVESRRNLPAPLIWSYSLQGAVQQFESLVALGKEAGAGLLRCADNTHQRSTRPADQEPS